jgi:HD-like signal output (HDOD) protein
MKKFLSRLLGSDDNDAEEQDSSPQPQASASPASGGGPAERYEEVTHEFFHWVTRTVAKELPPETEKLILDQLARVSASPAEAADLVPRVPDVIPQLLRGLRDEDMAGTELARLVARDVVLVAAVLREANSAYYRQTTEIRSLEGAIMLLGQDGLRMLIARVALRPIISIQTGRIAKRVATRIWSQSEKCGMAASLLAPGVQANQFEAYLAGLMQNVGLLAAVRLIDQVCPDEGLPSSDQFTDGLLASARTLSANIARHWELPESVSSAIAQAGLPGAQPLAQVLALGETLSKLRLMVDEEVYAEDAPVLQGFNAFQLRCFEKLRTEDE